MDKYKIKLIVIALILVFSVSFLLVSCTKAEPKTETKTEEQVDLANVAKNLVALEYDIPVALTAIKADIRNSGEDGYNDTHLLFFVLAYDDNDNLDVFWTDVFLKDGEWHADIVYKARLKSLEWGEE